MKTRLLLTPFIILLFSFIALTSCNTIENNNQTKTYTAGFLLSENVANIYIDAQNHQNFISSYQNDLAQILNGRSLDTFYTRFPELVNNFEIKLNIFSTFSDIMVQLQNQNDVTENDIIQNVHILLNFVDSLKDTAYTEKIYTLREYTGSMKFDFNVAMYEISEVCYQIYNNDVAYWMTQLNLSFNTFSKSIDRIPPTMFDDEKLQKFVYEPYADKTTLVNIYKLNLKQDAYEQKSRFLDKATTLCEVFSHLRDMFMKISMENSDIKNNDYYIEQILNELKNYDKKNNIQVE